MMGLFVAVLLASCMGNITPSKQIDDAILSSNVSDALSGDPDLQRYDIVVDASNGVVTLLGAVGTEMEIAKAGMIAERVDGVVRVINKLRVN